MDKLIQLLAEISFLFGVPTVMDIPTVVELSPNMVVKTCGVRVPACYIRPMIYMRDDLEGEAKKVVLFHEVTHHVQEMIGSYGTIDSPERSRLREVQAKKLTKYVLE